MNRTELYDAVTAQVVGQIEAGAGPWSLPWHAIADAGSPVNALTGKEYRGSNFLSLGMAAVARGWSGSWATYRQWQELGAQVRRGETASRGVKWSPVEDRTTGEQRMIPSVFAVFNADQVDGWDAPPPVARDTPTRIAMAERFFAGIGAEVRPGGNRAFYVPSGDYIALPDLAQFDKASDYYGTRGHETVHWTGHPSRLARDLSGRFGSDAYAVEELIAEMGSAFLSARLGLSTTPRPDHAAYLASWLRVLRADSSALFAAAAKAQSACDYLFDRSAVSLEVAA